MLSSEKKDLRQLAGEISTAAEISPAIKPVKTPCSTDFVNYTNKRFGQSRKVGFVDLIMVL